MSMCKVISYVVEKEYLLWLVNSLGRIQLAFALFILFSKAKFAFYSRYILISNFCIPIPDNE